jgi:hypothetical protein
MAIIQAPPNRGLQSLIEVLMQKQQNELAAEKLKIDKGNFKLATEKFQAEQQIQQQQEQQQLSFIQNLLRQGIQGDPVAQQTAQEAGLFNLTRDQMLGMSARPSPAQPSVIETTHAELQAKFDRQKTLRALDPAYREVGERALTLADQGMAPTLISELLAKEMPQTELDKLNLQRTETALAGDKVTVALDRMKLDRDPARVNSANSLWQSGAMPWKEAREAAGLAAGGIPDDAMFVDPAAAGRAGGAEAQKKLGFAIQMQSSHAIINQMVDATGGLKFLPSIQRQTQSSIIDATINLINKDPNQQRLVQAHRMFGDAYRFSLSGQQSSDREALRMLNAVAEQVGDQPETITQKKLMRETMIQLTFDAANGLITPTEGMDRMISNALRLGYDPEGDFMDVLREQRIDAISWENQIGNATILSSDPTTADTLGATAQRIRDFYDENFEVRR